MDRCRVVLRRRVVLDGLAFFAIALFTFHAVSSLVFSVLGLAPSSPSWGLALTLAGFLAVAGAAVGLQSRLPQRVAGLISGGASVAIVGFYSFGQLSGQAAIWATAGAVAGLLIGGGLGFWAAGRRGFMRIAIGLVSIPCAYGCAFGLGTWTLAAIDVQRWGMALILGGLTILYLQWTKQAIIWIYRQWKHLYD